MTANTPLDETKIPEGPKDNRTIKQRVLHTLVKGVLLVLTGLRIAFRKIRRTIYRLVFFAGWLLYRTALKKPTIALYQLYLFSEQRLERWLFNWGLPLVIFGLTLFVLFGNRQAAIGHSDEYGRDSYLFSFAQSENEALITANVGVTPDEFATPEGSVVFQPIPTTMEEQLVTDQGVISYPLPSPGSGPSVRREIIEYIVQSGDTVEKLAKQFGISADTVLLANKLTARVSLRPGQRLRVLPTSGLEHMVKSGDTLQSIATRYKADPNLIAHWNDLSLGGRLSLGQSLVVPGGQLPPPPPAPKLKPIPAKTPGPVAASIPPNTKAKLLWPTESRRLTQGFKLRHPGLDIGMPVGAGIYASEDGVVDKAGWNTGGYGFFIILDHQKLGLQTLYAHNSKLLVKAGDQVKRGQLIALSGSTGKSTGPHLHWEVRGGSRRFNPLNFSR